ncbi:uncharacterized protein LOC126706975 isoform X2 [Quercus robur]|uniref:uncharacterized protein LOC126706975 isoform X2 n=1 Tax=Quercus robur TaxID=38942 RepID=UPI0021611595|nr:uncharacterized protein LOC126706975 isoform X2 [Quercus robur]
MDDEVLRVEVKKMKTIRRDTAAVCAIALRITGSLINMVLLLWTIHSGIEIATETEAYMDYEYSQWAFHVGVVTMFFGFLFLALGIPILADLFLKLTEQLQQQEEENGTHQAREMTNPEVIGGILVNVITVFMLLWGIYTGIRLAVEPRGDSKYRFLTFSIGLITIVFGCLYFIFGLAITMELALDLSSRLQQKEKKGSSIHKGHNKNVKCFV